MNLSISNCSNDQCENDLNHILRDACFLYKGQLGFHSVEIYCSHNTCLNKILQLIKFLRLDGQINLFEKNENNEFSYLKNCEKAVQVILPRSKALEIFKKAALEKIKEQLIC